MVNVKYITMGGSAFIIGYIYMLIMTYMGIPLIDVGETLLTSFGGLQGNTIQAISWILIFVFYLFVAVVLPLNWIYLGITEKPKDGQEPNKFMMSVLALFMIALGIMLLVFGWYGIIAMSDIITNANFGSAVTTILQVFYWLGLIASWIAGSIVAPVSIFMQMRE